MPSETSARGAGLRATWQRPPPVPHGRDTKGKRGTAFPFASARIHTAVFSGTYEEISSPSALLLRIRLADANAPCALSLSWSIAIRCTVCGTILEFNDKIALQYSIPKMQFGFVSSSAVSAPSAFFTASVRAAANETPFVTSGRISELNTSECKYSAQCMRGAVSPVSLQTSVYLRNRAHLITKCRRVQIFLRPPQPTARAAPARVPRRFAVLAVCATTYRAQPPRRAAQNFRSSHRQCRCRTPPKCGRAVPRGHYAAD